MEHWMDLPGLGNAEAIGSSGDNLINFKWTSSFHLELPWSIHSEVGGFEPDLISFLPQGEFGRDPFLHFLLGNLMSGLGIISGCG